MEFYTVECKFIIWNWRVLTLFIIIDNEWNHNLNSLGLNTYTYIQCGILSPIKIKAFKTNEKQIMVNRNGNALL